MFRKIKDFDYKEMYNISRYINKKEDMRRRKSFIKQNINKLNKLNLKEYSPYLAKTNQNKHIINTSLRNMLRKSPTRKNKNNYDIILKNAVKLPDSKSRKSNSSSGK